MGSGSDRNSESNSDSNSDGGGHRPAGPPRGVLSDGAVPDGAIEHRRLLPGAALAPFVAHFWWVRWALRRPFVAETLAHPTVHITFEAPSGRAEITGVPTGRFTRWLDGEGRVFGVKLRPGAFQPFTSFTSITSMAALAGRTVPVAALFGDEADVLARRLRDATTLEEAIVIAQPFLEARRPALSGEAAAVRDLAERIERDRELVRVEQAAALAGVPVRTLERRFRRYIGVGPKAVIRRYRLLEAAELLKGARPPSLATIAAELGYTDQSHFARDFKAVVGRTPRAFVDERRRRRLSSSKPLQPAAGAAYARSTRAP